jgi:hypothetical protein
MTLRKDATVAWGPFDVPVTADQTDFKIQPDWSAQALPNPAQTGSITLQMTVAGYVQPVDASDPSQGEECFVVVDLGKTEVSPGQLIKNDAANRGWYTHSIDVEMYFDGDTPYCIDADTPQSYPATGSGNMSTGTSETLSFFGTDLTGGLSASQSQGGGRTYADFEVSNTTTREPGNHQMRHHLALRVCDAGPYEDPYSLCGPDKNLVGLPPRATSNNQLTSAAAFVAVMKGNPMARPEPATLCVNITHTAAIVFFSPNGSKIDIDEMNQLKEPFSLNKGLQMLWIVMLSGIYAAAPAGTMLAWRFLVDFKKGQVTAQ